MRPGVMTITVCHYDIQVEITIKTPLYKTTTYQAVKQYNHDTPSLVGMRLRLCSKAAHTLVSAADPALKWLG